MRIKTYNKKRNLKSEEEYTIKYLMNKYKVSKKDICVIKFKNKNGRKYKFYVCGKNSKLLNYYPSQHFRVEYKYGEVEHPSVIKNENN